MSSPRSFDRLTGIYRTLEYVSFGRDLERARFAHLDTLRDSRFILVLGEGDGRCLQRLVRRAPQARIDCLDISPAMLARAAARITGTEAVGRVEFRQADLLRTELPPRRYDAVVTFFFLDCFTGEQAEKIMQQIHGSLQPEAIWLWADFALPSHGVARWRARAWLALLYTFFRWQTNLDARALPPVERLFDSLGWKPAMQRSFQHGLVRSAVFRREI
jgi:ubiquinone/menaquinone biosynthesis C-methylase UbiE